MSVATRVTLVLIRGYQGMVSPWLPAGCRFAPTCSEYARLAVRDHGAARGGWLALGRLLRCQPFHPGGYDPPPATGPGRA